MQKYVSISVALNYYFKYMEVSMRVRKAIAQAFVFVFILVAVTSIVSMSAKADSTWDDTLVVEDAKYWGIATRVQSDRYGVKIGDEYYKITKVEEYVKGVGIDVFAALRGKAGIIAVGETPIPDGTWKIAQTFSESDKSFKVIYTPTTDSIKELGGLPATKAIGGEYGYLVGLVGKGIVKEVGLFDDNDNYYIEVKHNNNWISVYKNDYFNKNNINNILKMLTQNGSTLNFRMREGNWHWPTKEIKVKIPTQPKAPAVKFNLSTDTSNIKHGMEYTLLSRAALDEFLKDGEATWKKIDGISGLSVGEITSAFNALNKNKDEYFEAYLLARTSASSKKIASKYSLVKVFSTYNHYGKTTKLKLNATSTESSIWIDGGDNKYSPDKVILAVRPNLPYDVTKGATIINNTGLDVEYATCKQGYSTTKWTLLKGKEGDITKKSIRYSEYYKSGTYDNSGTSGISFRWPGYVASKGAVLALPFDVGGVNIEFKNVEQNLSSPTGGAVTVSAIAVATGKAITHEIKLKITNAYKMNTAPKIKMTNKVKGITVTASKVTPSTDSSSGYAILTVKINKAAFNTEEAINNAVLRFNLKYESIDEPFEITFEKK